MADSIVRRATAADAATIADIQILLWQQAFAELLPAGVVFTDPVQHTVTWDARLRQGGPVLLASRARHPSGSRPCRASWTTATCSAPIGEIEVLYVVPRWGRRGHGGRLLAGAAAELRRIGATSAQWWIPESDKASTTFLARAAWSADGVRRELDTGASRSSRCASPVSVDLVAV